MIDLETLMLAAKMGGGGGGSGGGGTVILTVVPNQTFSAAEIYLGENHVTIAELLNLIEEGKSIVADVDAGDIKIRFYLWQSTTETVSVFGFANSPVDGKINIVRAVIGEFGGLDYATAAIEFIPIENS